MAEKYIITSALPYVNYELHLGHFAGCLLPADVYSRFLKQQGKKCIYVCGTDEYGTPSTIAAEKEGIPIEELVRKNHDKQRKAVEGFNLDLDVFSGTSLAGKEHVKVVQEMYNRIKANNYIYKKEVEQFYCPKCDRFLPDRYVLGTCPHCEGNARGDQCEDCNRVLEVTEIKNPRCAVCGTSPEVKKEEHAFFELSKLENELKEWIEKNTHWPANARNTALSWIKQGLEDKDITRNLKWGVPVPDLPGQVFYVWFDAPIGYITFTKQIGKESWWHDSNTRIVHFLGKDNIPFHTLFFPAMLIADGTYTLPYQIASQEYLNYAKGKFSKSARRGLFALDALEVLPADYWRYYIISVLPTSHDTEFTWEDFQQKVNSELNDTLGNFIHRTLTFTKKFLDNKIPGKENLNQEDERVLDEVNKTIKEAEKLLLNIKLKEGLEKVMEIARIGNRYLTKEEPWRNKERMAPVVYTCLRIARALGVVLEPFLPETARLIRNWIGVNNGSWDTALQDIPSGQQVGEFRPLFNKIDDKKLEEIKKHFGVEEEMEEQKEAVEYSDFVKLDLVTAVVKKAEKVEGADKLLKLELDTGKENRTVVAGLAPYYQPEEMIGKQVIYLKNLKPRKLRGIESQGMILAAEGEQGNVALLTVDKKMEPGAKVE